MRTLLILITVTLAAYPVTISNDRNIGSTATQAIIAYDVIGNNTCTVQIREKDDSTVINDVNESLFPNSSKDDRPGNVRSGNTRFFVVGKRSADLAVDGKRYSRALQAYTEHTYTIQCGADSVSGTFRTSNVPLGSTYLDFAPYDPDKVGSVHSTGYYGWPTWDDTPRAALPGYVAPQRIVDPETGILLRRMTLPGDHPFPYDLAPTQKISSVMDPDGAWTNPNSVIDDDANSAVLNGGRHALLMAFKMAANSGSSSLDTLKVAIKGFGGGVTADDRRLDVCLVLDGINCATSILQVDLPSSMGQVTAVKGNGTLSDWMAPGEMALDSADIKPFAGYVNTNDTNVTWVSGDYFSMHWSSGSRISINNVTYVIDHVMSPKALVLTTPAGTQPGIGYKAWNFGVRVVKTTDTSSQITLQELEIQVQNSLSASWPSAQSMNMCAETTTKDSTGVTGYHCVNFATGALYWISTATGEARLIAPTQVSGNGVFTTASCIIDSFAFDPQDPNSFYCLSQLASDGSKLLFLKATYNGDDSGLPVVSDNSTLQNTTCRLRQGGTGPCGSAVNITKSNDLRGELAAFAGNQYNSATWPGFVFVGGQGHYLLAQTLRAGQDSDGWVAVFDANQGQIIAATSSFSSFPLRWSSIHTVYTQGEDANPWINLGVLQSNFFSKSVGAPLSSSPAISAGSSGCPAQSRGCDLITIDHEPQNGGGTGLVPIAVNDIVCLAAQHPCSIGGNPNIEEWGRVIAKNGLVLTVDRAVGNGVLKDWTGTGTLYVNMISTMHPLDSQGWQSSVNGWWNFIDDPHGNNTGGNTVLQDPTLFSHVSFYKGVMVQSGIGVDFRKGSLPGSIGAPFTHTQVIVPPFAGVSGVGAPLSVESHPSVLSIPPSEQWGLDANTFLLGGQPPWNTNSVSPIEGSLYKIGATDVFLNRKIVPTFASCGPQPLKDISSALKGDVLSGGKQDWFKYCVADTTGECRGNSAPGEVFINCPLYAYGSGAACPAGNPDSKLDWLDICVANNMPPTQAIVQIGFSEKDSSGKLRRVLTTAGTRLHQVSRFWSARSLPDASWFLYPLPTSHNRYDVFIGKLPPYPSTDSMTRSDFIQVRLPDLKPQANRAIDNVIVEFGYGEYGPADAHFCTSRQEACVRGDQQGNDFGFTKDSVPGVSCADSCSVTIPAIPSRILYYQVKYRNSANQVVYSDDPAVFATP